MDPSPDPRFRIHPRPQASLMERIIFFVLGLAVLVAAFFFISIALVAGALLAGVILLRFWWLRRQLRKAHEDSYVEGEYRVVEAVITDKRQSGD
jgi:protein-S-isoprenylcysteine O-methyltransferase Ste14